MRKPVLKKVGGSHRKTVEIASAPPPRTHTCIEKKKMELLWKHFSLHLRKLSAAPFPLLSLTLFLTSVPDETNPEVQPTPPIPIGETDGE